VVFRVHHPSPSFLTSVAHPANFIFAKKYLDQDPHYYKTHAVGTGPFMLKNYVRGSHIELERNPNYWKKGLPYLDGITYFIIKDSSARAKALRSDRVDMELRYLPRAETDAIKAQLDDQVVVAAPRSIATHGVTSMWTRSRLTMNGCARP
jgi:peptide/nickel transport system substrate-binding protein